ncbi:alpha/beta hydrolase [soil metagenome]
MYADIDGPDEATDVVLWHGGTGTGSFHWSRVGRSLAERYRVHLPDLPGHGRSPLPDDGSYDRRVLSDAVEEYLSKVGTPVHVGAFSMGGHACLDLAQRRPDVFASLTLVGVSVRDHDGLAGWRGRFDPDRLQREVPVFARHLSKLHEPLGGPDAWRDVCRRDAGGLEVAVDLDALAGLEVPVLLARGDRDLASDPSQYAELRATWPQADEFVVPAAGHDVPLTRHQLLEPVLADFLDRVDA